jgi:hypothetical protein
MSSVTRIRSAGRSPAYSGSIQGTALEYALDEVHQRLYDLQGIIDVTCKAFDLEDSEDEQPSYYRALRAASTCVDNIVTALQADALEERAQEIANRATTSERKS